MNTLRIHNKRVKQYKQELDRFRKNSCVYDISSGTITSKASNTSRRSLQLKDPPGKEIVLSTYFTTKSDPQRKQKVKPADFEYIKAWYFSIMHSNLRAVVFIDFQDKDFVLKYENEHIKFVYCTLGQLSLNDERFFIFDEYLSSYINALKYACLSDINDVTFNKNPFLFFKTKPMYTLFVGRNHTDKIMFSKINQERMTYLTNKFGLTFPGNFYIMPVYNAGIVGGEISVVAYLIKNMCNYFREFESEKNLNMLILNMTIYSFFCPSVVTSVFNFLFRSRKSRSLAIIFEKVKMKLSNKTWNQAASVKHLNDICGNTKTIFTSYPMHNKFKSFYSDSNEYILHK